MAEKNIFNILSVVNNEFMKSDYYYEMVIQQLVDTNRNVKEFMSTNNFFDQVTNCLYYLYYINVFVLCLILGERKERYFLAGK